MKAARTIFFSWLPLAIAICGMCLLVALAVQQNYRQSLNDPQIQMTEDAASAIDSGADPGTIVAGFKAVDIGESLTPWIAAFDASGTIIVSSGSLNGASLKLPAGVFGTSGEDRFSWQPSPDVRQAVVLIHTKSGVFVAAGRSMREVENREGSLNLITLLAAVCMLGATLVAQAIRYYIV